MNRTRIFLSNYAGKIGTGDLDEAASQELVSALYRNLHVLHSTEILAWPMKS